MCRRIYVHAPTYCTSDWDRPPVPRFSTAQAEMLSTMDGSPTDLVWCQKYPWSCICLRPHFKNGSSQVWEIQALFRGGSKMEICLHFCTHWVAQVFPELHNLSSPSKLMTFVKASHYWAVLILQCVGWIFGYLWAVLKCSMTYIPSSEYVELYFTFITVLWCVASQGIVLQPFQLYCCLFRYFMTCQLLFKKSLI